MASGLPLNGASAVVGNVLRLTPSSPFVSGSTFSTNTVSLTSDSSFSNFFTFRMSNTGGISDEDGQGADGIVFTLQMLG